MTDVPAGVGVLKRVISQTEIPVLAIGGVNEERLKEVWMAGAAGFAGIGLFIESAREGSTWTVGLTALVQRVRRSFDSARPHV
jgi:thiamine monophosphate synthase